MKKKDITKKLLKGETCENCSIQFFCRKKLTCYTCKNYSKPIEMVMRTYPVKSSARKLNVTWTQETELEVLMSRKAIKSLEKTARKT